MLLLDGDKSRVDDSTSRGYRVTRIPCTICCTVSLLSQAVVSSSMDWFRKFWVNSISTLSKIIRMLNFPRPFYLLYLLLNSCNGNDATPTTWSSTSLTREEAYHKMSSAKLLDNGKNMCMHEGERTSLWTSAKIKGFSQPLTVYRGNCIVSHHFRCSYLKANKVSKSEETRKVECAYNCWKCADGVYLNLSESVRASLNYSLPKLARFFKMHCSIGAVMLHTDWPQTWLSMHVSAC